VTAGVVVLLVAAAFLLLSQGGGIIAAPVTLRLVFVVVRRHPTRGFRIAGAFIGGLTAAELAWGVVYLLVGEVRVVVWLLPLVAGVTMAYAVAALPPGW
jgi:hypothetical protein